MKLKQFTVAIAQLITGFIQTGCGSANPNMYGYNQFQNGCPMGTTVQNGMCMPTSNQNSACSSGPSYPMGPYGCSYGYVGQGSNCVCQSQSQNTTATATQGSAQCKTGYFAVIGASGCYQQSNCQSGFALTPSPTQYSYYNSYNGGYCSKTQQ